MLHEYYIHQIVPFFSKQDTREIDRHQEKFHVYLY